jgi:hypothetical protein
MTTLCTGCELRVPAIGGMLCNECEEDRVALQDALVEFAGTGPVTTGAVERNLEHLTRKGG